MRSDFGERGCQSPIFRHTKKDEESILQMAMMALEAHGFVVHTALGGAVGISDSQFL